MVEMASAVDWDVVRPLYYRDQSDIQGALDDQVHCAQVSFP